MKTIYAVISGNSVSLVSNFNEDLFFKMEYSDHMMGKDLFLCLLLGNAGRMGGEELVLYDFFSEWKHEIKVSALDDDYEKSIEILKASTHVKRFLGGGDKIEIGTRQSTFCVKYKR